MAKLSNEPDPNAIRGSNRYVKIKESGTTPIRLLSDDYESGYIHWVNLPDGTKRKVAAVVERDEADHVLHGGWDNDHDPLTKMASDLLKQSKEMEASGASEEEVKVVKDKAKNLMPRYEACLLVAVGEMVKYKEVVKGKAVYTETADFSSAKVGMLNLNDLQRQALVGFIGSPEHPYIESIDDLMEHTIFISKAGKNSKWIFSLEEEATELPELDYDPDDFDLGANFVADEEEVRRLAKILKSVYADDEIEPANEDDAEMETDSSEDGDDEGKVDEEGALPDFQSETLPWEDGRENPYRKLKPKLKPAVSQSEQRRKTSMAKSQSAPVKRPVGRPPKAAPAPKGGKPAKKGK